ncbi:MAG: NUDIX domain-containing protein [Planctomycetota bacterium]
MTGPRVRTDIVDVYLLRPSARSHDHNAHHNGDQTHDLLLLRRARAPLAGQWHPVMGHVEPGERAMQTALREAGEETGLTPDAISAWFQLEQTFPFFLADRDEVHLSPRFAVVTDEGFEPALNNEHDAHRWVPVDDAENSLLWPGQRHAIREIRSCILPGGPTADSLRLPRPADPTHDAPSGPPPAKG